MNILDQLKAELRVMDVVLEEAEWIKSNTGASFGYQRKYPDPHIETILVLRDAKRAEIAALEKK